MLRREVPYKAGERLTSRLRPRDQRHAFQGRRRGKHDAGGAQPLDHGGDDCIAAVDRCGDVDRDLQQARTVRSFEGPQAEPGFDLGPVLPESRVPAGVLAEGTRLASDLGGEQFKQGMRRRLARLQGTAGAAQIAELDDEPETAEGAPASGSLGEVLGTEGVEPLNDGGIGRWVEQRRPLLGREDRQRCHLDGSLGLVTQPMPGNVRGA